MNCSKIGQSVILLTLLLCAPSTGYAQGYTPNGPVSLKVVVDPSRTGIEIREDFIGLSYEKDVLTQPRVFTPENHVLHNLFANLGRGNLRIGAGAVEETGWTRQRRTASTGDKTVAADDLDRFYAFVKMTGWSVVHAVNCRKSNPSVGADEAEYAASQGGDSILAFEIGNEPDLGPFGPSDRYEVQDYVKDFRTFAAAIRKRVLSARFVGPGATYFGQRELQFLTRGIDEWTVPFADIMGKDIVQLTHHIYVVGQPDITEPDETFTASIPALLSSASRDRYLATLEKLEKAAEGHGIPYRINEANSCYWGGRDCVSNTFASALWGADFLFTLASYGAGGVNLHAGTQIYTPILTRESEKSAARPLYYGLLMFHACGTGRLIPAKIEGPDNFQVSAYAVLAKDGSVSVAIINRDAIAATVELDVTRYFDTGRVLRLEGPALSAKAGVTFGGTAVREDGTWAAASDEVVSRKDRVFTVRLPGGSAALIKFDKTK